MDSSIVMEKERVVRGLYRGMPEYSQSEFKEFSAYRELKIGWVWFGEDPEKKYPGWKVFGFAKGTFFRKPILTKKHG